MTLFLSAVSILRMTGDSDGLDDDDDSSDWGSSSGDEDEGGSAMVPASLPQFEALVPQEEGLRCVCVCVYVCVFVCVGGCCLSFVIVCYSIWTRR